MFYPGPGQEKADPKMMKNLMIAAVVAAASLGGYLMATGGSATGLYSPLVGIANAETAAPATAEEAPLPPVIEMVMGQDDAPVTVIEYASFTCPHCGNFHRTVFDEFKKNYIDTGKVRFVYREVYFDKFGLWAAMVARCGGEMKYFGIADMIYDTQKDWIGDAKESTIAANLRKMGLTAGISQDQLDACLNDQPMAKALVTNFQKNAEADGIESTPTFLINGTKVAGEMEYDEFAKLLDAAAEG
jgi:protein-disulfide isomerase